MTALLLGALLLSGCTSGSGEPGEPGAQPSSGGATPTTASVDPDPDGPPTVPPPGPLDAPVVGPDLLISGDQTLDAATVRAIRRLRGVSDVEQFSLAQVPIENRVLDVAAVDPGGYRRFTRVESAQLQEQWDRVAGGELAIRGPLGRRYGDPDGRIRLGTSPDAPTLHIGAYAPQIPRVDAVVNEGWGQALGMIPGNAVVVHTGGVAPQSVRPALQKLLGDRAQVQLTDAVARYGLDPSVSQTAVLVGTVSDAVGVFTYSVVGGGRIAPDPAWVRAHITTEVVPILGSVTCNRLLFPQLRAALQEIVDRNLADKIHPDEYAGCYYPRFIAGTTTLSNHSFGLALDLNVPGNQRGTVGEIDRTVVAIFEKWGFGWGGRWRWTDPMHFEMNALVDPR